MADSTPRTTFKALVTLTRDYLITGLGLPTERVFRSLHPVQSEVGFKADKYVILRAGGSQVDGQWADSEGRYATAVTRELIVEPWLRDDQNDITSNDKLFDKMMDMEDAIIDLLQIYEPRFALEPYHYLGIAPESAKPIVPKWGTSSMRFSVKFLQDVDQRWQ